MKIKKHIQKKEKAQKYVAFWKQSLIKKFYYFLKFFILDISKQIKDKSFNEYALTIFSVVKGRGKLCRLWLN